MKHRGGNQKIIKDFFQRLSAICEAVGLSCACILREKKNKWPTLFEQDKQLFVQVAPQKNLTFVLAQEESVVLSEQLKNADVIYLRGGSTPALKAVLGMVENLVDLLKDKIVVGSSAGAYVLSKYYYTHERDCIDEGLDVLPVKTMCHYVEDRADKLRDLKEFAEGLPVYAIPEEKFVVLEKKE